MDIPFRQTNKSRGKDFQLESSIAAISGANLKRIKLGGKFKGKENSDSRGRDSEVLGNEISKAVVKVSPLSFNLLVSSQEQLLGILEHMLVVVKGVELPGE